MKVKFLSGNEEGAVVDLPPLEAQIAFDTGFARPLTKEEEPAEPAIEGKPIEKRKTPR